MQTLNHVQSQRMIILQTPLVVCSGIYEAYALLTSMDRGHDMFLRR